MSNGLNLSQAQLFKLRDTNIHNRLGANFSSLSGVERALLEESIMQLAKFFRFAGRHIVRLTGIGFQVEELPILRCRWSSAPILDDLPVS